MLEFIKKALDADSSVSSKRLAGITGWAVSMCILIYATIAEVKTPDSYDMFFITSATLLGLDSVTSVVQTFRKPK